MPSLAELPDDPVLLKQFIAQRDQVIVQRDQIIVQRDQVIVQRDQVIAQREAAIEQVRQEAAGRIQALEQRHKAELAALLRRLYGSKCERFDPRQLLLFGLTVQTLAEQAAPQGPADTSAASAPETKEKEKPRRHNHGRGTFPASLPREVINHDLSEPEKKCPCCGEVRCRIGEVRTEQLEVELIKFKVLEHVQAKYACTNCEKQGENPQIEVAPKPLSPIHRGVPGPVLLALIIVSKFVDHLPLYRLESIFGRAGADITRGTMCRWLLALAELVKPLYDLMGQRIREGRKIHTDDTRMPVQVKPEKPGPAPPAASSTGPPAPAPPSIQPANPGTTSAALPADVPAPTVSPALQTLLLPALNASASTPGTVPVPVVVAAVVPALLQPPSCPAGRMWVYLGDAAHPYTVFDYTGDRTRTGPATWLAGYDQYLQADAFSAYDGIYARGVIEVGCWAHARRKFFDARESDGRRSAQMLAMIGELYAVEEEARKKQLDEASVLALRKLKSVPVLARIRKWLDEELKLVLPRSPIAAAMGYVVNQWQALNVYTTAGFLEIDNNAAEREMKKVATGRKNWLFAGTEEGARASAMLYSLVASALRHGLNPLEYLADVLARLPELPMSQLPTLLPDEWKRAKDHAR